MRVQEVRTAPGGRKVIYHKDEWGRTLERYELTHAAERLIYGDAATLLRPDAGVVTLEPVEHGQAPAGSPREKADKELSSWEEH